MTDDTTQRAASCYATLVARCERDRRWMSGDGRVDAETAADLLGVAPATLRNWRYMNQGPRPYKVGTRVSYRLLDLAIWLETKGSSEK